MNSTKEYPSYGAILDTGCDEPLSLARHTKCEALDKASIADLSATLIESMTQDELVRVIQASELRTMHHSELPECLAFYDRDTLVRLAHLAQQSCRSLGS